MNKYYNKQIKYGDEVFDSKKEYSRWLELRLLLRAGKIKDLQRQVKYVLIPAQKYGKKVIERECCYFADFQYIDTATGETIVEDTKGIRTKDYIIKRKLMLYRYNIRIREV